MIDFKGISEALQNPAMRHAIFVHAPIVLSQLGVLLSLAAAIWRKNTTLRVIAITCYSLLLLASIITVNSGEAAEDAAGQLSKEAYTIAHEHEEMAEKVWLFAAGTTALLIVSAFRKPAIRIASGWMVVLVSVAAALWVGQIGHLGGTLVYQHGVGTSKPHAAGSPPTTQSAAPQEDARVAFFRSDVLPILTSNCFRCHNPTKAARSGKLDQTSHETILKGGRHGPAIVPGKPDESYLIQRVKGAVPDEDIMPPNGKLPDASIGKLEQWIRDGAVWADTAPSAITFSGEPG